MAGWRMMCSVAVVAAAVAATAVPGARGQPSQCKTQLKAKSDSVASVTCPFALGAEGKGTNAVFSNIGELTLTQGFYNATYRQHLDTPFLYFFNVLGTVPKGSVSPAGVGLPASCQSVAGAVALQYDPRTDKCYALSSSEDLTYIFELQDSQDPARGVQVGPFSGGTKCGDKDRKVLFKFTCNAVLAEKGYKFPKLSEAPTEDNTCEYVIEATSQYFCPDACTGFCGVKTNGVFDSTGDCVTSTVEAGGARCACVPEYVGPGCAHKCPAPADNPNEVCSGTAFGHCEYDPEIEKAKCFCSAGYQGDFCLIATSGLKTPSASPQGGMSVAGAIGFILFGIAIVGIIIVWGYHRQQVGEPFCCCGSGGAPAFSADTETGDNQYNAPSLL